MSKKKRKSKGNKGGLWAEAKRRCRLNQEEVRMAQEMGLNPRSLIKNIPSPTQLWKAPVREWIRDMYERRQEKAARKRQRRAAAEGSPEPASQVSRPTRQRRPTTKKAQRLRVGRPAGTGDSQVPGGAEDPFADVDAPFVDDPSAREDDPLPPQLALFDPFDETEERVRQEAVEDDHRNVGRHRHFGQVARWVAAVMAEIPNVHRVVLFGSAALPLGREVPRWRKYRRLGLEIAHHCKDVDLAVWVDDLSCLRALQRARNVTVNEYYRATNFGIAQHQIEVFLLEQGTDRYLGRLCIFGKCPRTDKTECRVPGCGSTPHLRQHEGFTLKREALSAERSVVLFDRQGSAFSNAE